MYCHMCVYNVHVVISEPPYKSEVWMFCTLQLEDFEKVRVLGVGGTGIVYELLHKTNGQRFAMKEMEIKNKTQMRMAVQEAEMLKDIMENVSHPNIMHIERVFQVGSKFYMVFPLCTGGELYEHIIKKGHFTEHDAAVITRDLISGLHALHEHDILHLDIKPENILFDSMEEDAKIKITDFGLSKVFSDADHTAQVSHFSMKNMQERLAVFLESGEMFKERLRGTVGYMSPELILTGYCSKATDVYAAGVVLYILLCGRPPFNSKSNREVLEKTAKGVYRLAGGEWEHISAEAKDLVRKMLTTNPLERITTAQILEHPWIAQLDDEEEEDEVSELETSFSSTMINKHMSTLAGLVDDTTPAGTGTGTGTGGAAGSGATAAGSGNAASGTSDSLGKKLSRSNNSVNRKRSGANLVGTLRQLSGHVKQRRSEKLATNLSRLVSSLLNQQDGAATVKSTLANQYLIPVDTGTGSTLSNGSSAYNGGTNNTSYSMKGKTSLDGNDGSDTELLVLNSDFRAALIGAISKLEEFEDGKVTIEQFAAIINNLIGINTVSLTSVLMGR